MADLGEEWVEQVGTAGLVVVGGAVALALQGRPELEAGVEEGAGFADRFQLWAEAAGVEREQGFATLRSEIERDLADAARSG